MQSVDLNLLIALDALLTERSVTGAARRLGLSPSAMSRALARLRHATGDPLLVQAGRSLVPTPYAEKLGGRVPALTQDVQAVLRPPASRLDLAALHRTFTIRAGEGFVELLSAPLMAAITRAAPHVRLRFAPKPDKDAQPLRDGRIDLEIGVLGTAAPEVRTQLLFRDRSVGVARTGHPLLGPGGVTPERYAACSHVVASREGDFIEPVDHALEALGLKRTVRLVVPGHPDAMRIASRSDLVALVPRSCLGNALAADHAAILGLQSFELPVRTPEFAISAIWHPRLDADPAHRWLRDTIMAVGREAYP
ncbi:MULTISPECIES: LysR family transcriptional regulator [unclassified Inquilinus]|uniref:LysR family transcriptional regulator n=1 Tax=unclassified Inquilinus TaxID=2645927 RepID=UPI003F8F34F6